MPDDRKPRRAGSVMGDTGRIEAGRKHRTPHRGVPADFGDEPTPPPSMALPDETLPLDEQLYALRRDVHEQHNAIGKLWDLRGTTEQLGRIEEKLGTLAEYATRHQTILDDLVVPWCKDTAARTDEIAREMPKLIASVELVTRDVGMLDKRVRDLEVDMRTSGARFDGSHQQHQTRLSSVETLEAALEQRVESLERDRDVSKALAKTAKKRSGGLAGGIAAIVAGIVSGLIAALK